MKIFCKWLILNVLHPLFQKHKILKLFKFNFEEKIKNFREKNVNLSDIKQVDGIESFILNFRIRIDFSLEKRDQF